MWLVIHKLSHVKLREDDGMPDSVRDMGDGVTERPHTNTF